MFSFWSSIGPEISISLLLLALLGLRSHVSPRAGLWIKASPDRVFEIVDLYDGKVENWGRTRTETELADGQKGIFRKTYITTLSTGAVQRFSALFSIARRQAPHQLEIRREGLEGRPITNELLCQTYRVTPGEGGCRLDICYNWGPRALLSQITARADLWGGIYRIKGLAEQGKPDDRPYFLISLAVATLTGLISFGTFTALLGAEFAAIVIFVLFVHEFGHLLAYWLLGQPWGRMIFLPFLGAVAVPRLPFDSQGQAVFSALMGPGFSALLAVASGLACVLWPQYSEHFLTLGLITVALNIFNLLPVEPLDGGIALRSVLHRLMGRYARFGLLAIGAILVAAGYATMQLILMAFGSVAIIANLRGRSIDAGLQRLSGLQVAFSLIGYVALVSAYVAMFRIYLPGIAFLET
jgi:Zn-dependent protease